jgi:hypothetical protein
MTDLYFLQLKLQNTRGTERRSSKWLWQRITVGHAILYVFIMRIIEDCSSSFKIADDQYYIDSTRPFRDELSCHGINSFNDEKPSINRHPPDHEYPIT